MDLAGYLAVLRRRLVAVVLCLFAGASGGLALAFSAQPVYQSTARTIVHLPAATQLQEALAGAQLSEHLVQTYAQIATSNAVATRASATSGLSPGEIRSSLTARVEPQTFLIDITASNHNAVTAQRIANATATALAAEVASLEKSRTDPVSVELLDSAGLPHAAVSPRKGRDIAVGVTLGLIAGLAVAALLEALDKTIKTTGQAVRSLRAPLLAVVPQFVARRTVVLPGDGPSQVVESFRTLRTAVRFAGPDEQPRHLLVTSPSAGDGKTTVAANLAMAIAASGFSVALVDADLRDGRIGRAFGLATAPGLSSVVNGKVTLGEALVEYAENLSVLPSGEAVRDPAELLGSAAMADAVEALSEFDVVIFDVPAVLAVTDAAVLAAHVDAVAVVVRHGQTERSAAAEARRRLDAVGARVLGVVLTAVPRGQLNQFPADEQVDRGVPRLPGAPATVDHMTG